MVVQLGLRHKFERPILLIRGQKVVLDRDLAELYGVETKALNRAVSRNLDRFPDDFMFQLTRRELSNLKYQIGTSSWGGARKLPIAFTEQGMACHFVDKKPFLWAADVPVCPILGYIKELHGNERAYR